MAIVLLVLRIVAPRKGYKIYVYVLAFIIIAYHLTKIFAFLFGCHPFAMNYDVTIKDGHCIDRFKLAVAFNVLNIITDIIMWSIPIPVVWHLQMSTKHKLEVLSVFGVGLIIIAIGAYRIYIQNTLVGITDFTWLYPDVHLWSCIELQVGIICGCMPPLKALFPRILPKSWFSHRSPLSANRLSQHHNKKDFSLLADSNATAPAPEWYDMEPGTKAFENLVISPPENERSHEGLNRELQDRGVPSPARAHVPVIHKQQDVDVDYSQRGVDGYELPRAM